MSGRRALRTVDEAEIARAGRSVGVGLALAFGILVLLGISAAHLLMQRQIAMDEIYRDLLDDHHYMTVSARDLMIAGATVGVLAIVVAGLAASWLTRKAVAPLAHALAAQRKFVADASHELRTPLSVLAARVQILEREAPADAPYRAELGVLNDEIKGLAAIVDDLLDVARSRETARSDVHARLSPVPAVRAAVDRLRVLAAEHGIEIRADVPDEDWMVRVPGIRIERCVTALLDNAIRLSPAGSEIVVSLSRVGSALALRVQDEGPGIPREDWERMFSRFEHGTREGGDGRRSHGLGLALVKDVIEAYGGSARVLSSDVAGTVIELRIPLVR